MTLHNAKSVFAIRRGPWKYIEGKPFGKVNPGDRQLSELCEKQRSQGFSR